LWYLVGSLFGVPRWLVDVTPFVHVGFVPTQDFQPVAAAVMAGIGLVAAATGAVFFRRRDIVGA
ncbi:MAG TPA: hypothetical protein VKR22_06485, partial [Acidimicrobiales bacterium]|nr:hypothetical protein [Acidimicrobiales bacterium]